MRFLAGLAFAGFFVVMVVLLARLAQLLRYLASFFVGATSQTHTAELYAFDGAARYELKRPFFLVGRAD
jgi:hypothetical protein